MPPLRVLLVHANPFQEVIPVPPYGLERLRTAIEAAGLAEVKIVDPYLLFDDPLEQVAKTTRAFRPDVVGIGIRIIEDLIAIDAIGGDEPFDLSWFLPQIKVLCQCLAEAAPGALLVAGGAGFSGFPSECLDYLELDWGVVGAGEQTICELLARLQQGRGLAGIGGLLQRGQDHGLASYNIAFLNQATEREPFYSPVYSFPVRTRVGCAMQCTYCLTANLQRRHGNGALAQVMAELEQLIETTRRRGLSSRAFIMFADEEFNLPDEGHAIALLEEIVARGLADSVQWRAYCNPAPFSDRLLDLIEETNGYASITVDTAAEAVMRQNNKPFRRRHLDQLAEQLNQRQMGAGMGFIFGMPGETEETIAETCAFIRALPPQIDVNYSAGARVYPHTPLATIARQEPQWLVGADDPSFLKPVFYSIPWPPRELARRLAEELGDLPNVRLMDGSYRDGDRTISQAYRSLAGGGDRKQWKGLCRQADAGRDPGVILACLAEMAAWHGRPDLVALTLKRSAQHAPNHLYALAFRLRGTRHQLSYEISRLKALCAPG